MNLIEKLMAVDKKEFDKIEKKELYSRELSKYIGAETKITVQAIDGDTFSALTGTAVTSDGKLDFGKSYDANAKIVASSLVDPNLKDSDLLKHLGAATPAEAAKKIFKGEINSISTVISELSGFGNSEETEKEIKN